MRTDTWHRAMRLGTLAALVLAGCTGGRDHAAERAVLRATLVELFATREQAVAITVWRDPREQAPTLSAWGPPWDHRDTLRLQVVDTTGLGLPFRVERTTLGDMERAFRDTPDAWDRWFVENPGNAGIVEVTRPRLMGDSAVLVVGRACGEICRSAWRVTLEREQGGASRGATSQGNDRPADGWRVRRVDVLTVPR
jgi:hypothetical protein